MQINTITLEYNKGLSSNTLRNALSAIIVISHMKSDTILSKSVSKAHLIYSLQKRNKMQYGISIYHYIIWKI